MPSGSALRKDYVPACGENMKIKVKAAVNDQPLVIVADETSDSKGRCVFAILLRTMTPTSQQEVFLASCTFLDTADGTSCSQAIIDCIKEYEIKYHNILGLVSDSARYMEKCFRALQTVIGDHLLHFQCYAHKVNLVGDVFLKEFSSLNSLVSKLKMAFLHSRKMKSRYLNFLEEKHSSLPALLFPAPVITRWNSWFQAVEYLHKYFHALVGFFNIVAKEPHNSSSSDVITMFQDKQLSQQLKIQITFVSEVCLKIGALITTLEGSKYPFAHKLWNELKMVRSSLERYAHGGLPSETEKEVNLCTNVTTKEKLKEQIRQCMQKCFAKLDSHMQGNRTNEFFMALGSLFDPTVAGQNVKIHVGSLETLKDKIPFFSEISRDDFIESYESFHDHLVANIRSNNEVDCLQMLLALKLTSSKFADAALKSIWAPTNSVDAERFFSKYNIILTDRRSRMTEETLETCSMLAFNA